MTPLTNEMGQAIGVYHINHEFLSLKLILGTTLFFYLFDRLVWRPKTRYYIGILESFFVSIFHSMGIYLVTGAVMYLAAIPSKWTLPVYCALFLPCTAISYVTAQLAYKYYHRNNTPS